LKSRKHLSKRCRAACGRYPVLESADLFRGSNEIAIRHDGAVYRLKITRQGKLILNK
jgi:hemin uptake protein HemP